LTVVTTSNAQRNGMVMWDEIAAEVASGYPDVKWDKMLVDAMTMRMVLKPESLDTIVATNLHADIISDLAAALAGSLGIAPTANLNPERKSPSMFEPIHGSAFDITGKGVANPIATFWTGYCRWTTNCRDPRHARHVPQAARRPQAEDGAGRRRCRGLQAKSPCRNHSPSSVP
jgi:isocitrate/isopropylmalate dehydrogenase